MDPLKIRLVLGSASPRRLSLLRGIGLVPRVVTHASDESFPEHLTGGEIALHVARNKATALLDLIDKDELLITADTIVWLEGTVLNKPSGMEEAKNMLRSLSGNTHSVFTGVSLFYKSSVRNIICESKVTFRKLTDEEIENYILRFSPFDKAGSYGAQECLPDGMNPCSNTEKRFMESIGKADLFEKSLAPYEGDRVPVIDKISGSYFNVMGLPIVEVWNAIKEMD